MKLWFLLISKLVSLQNTRLYSFHGSVDLHVPFCGELFSSIYLGFFPASETTTWNANGRILSKCSHLCFSQTRFHKFQKRIIKQFDVLENLLHNFLFVLFVWRAEVPQDSFALSFFQLVIFSVTLQGGFFSPRSKPTAILARKFEKEKGALVVLCDLET